MLDFKIKAVGDSKKMQFSGYASVFGVIDHVGDVTMKGTFKNALANPSNHVKLLALHDRWTRIPVGTITELKEDDYGLFFSGELADTTEGRDIYNLIKLDPMALQFSIGYKTIKERWNSSNGANILEEVELKEISFVPMACNEACQITDVKSRPNYKQEKPTMIKNDILNLCIKTAINEQRASGKPISLRNIQKEKALTIGDPTTGASLGIDSALSEKVLGTLTQYGGMFERLIWEQGVIESGAMDDLSQVMPYIPTVATPDKRYLQRVSNEVWQLHSDDNGDWSDIGGIKYISRAMKTTQHHNKTPISDEFLTDTSIDVMADVADSRADSLHETLGAQVAVGNGQPLNFHGITTYFDDVESLKGDDERSPYVLGATVATLADDVELYQNLVDLHNSLPSKWSNSPFVAYFMNTKTKSRIMKMKDTANQQMDIDFIESKIILDDNMPDIDLVNGSVPIAMGVISRAFKLTQQPSINKVDEYSLDGFVVLKDIARYNFGLMDSTAIRLFYIKS